MAMNKQRRTSNINNIITYDTLGNVTIPADLTVEGLQQAGLVRTDANGLFSVDLTAYTTLNSPITGYTIQAAGALLATDTILQAFGKLEGTLNTRVPYTGATANVDLGEYELKAGQIEYDQTPTGVAGVAVTRWNDSTGTIETTLKGGSVVLEHGRDMFERIVNKTGIQLTKAAYQAVRVSDAQGQRLAVQLAQANNDNNSADTIGLVVETIDDNQEGYIYTVGEIDGVNTTGTLQGETWIDGDVLYLSPTTAGRITNIKPVAPQHLIIIGYVIYAHQNNGKIYVKVMNGWELGELHDVNTTGAVAGNVLKYNGTIWTPSSDVGITSLNGLTATTQTFALDTRGNDVAIVSSGSNHEFIFPSASATRRGVLTSADWLLFFNKQNALTNPITGTGVSGQVSYWSGTNTQTGSNNLFWDNTNGRLGIGTNTISGIGGQRVVEVFAISYPTFRVNGNNVVNGVFVGNSQANVVVIGSETNHPLLFVSNNTDRGRFTAGGNLLINSTTDSGQRLQVTGDTLLRGSGNTSATTALTVQNSSSTNLFSVRNDGLVRIGDSGGAQFTAPQIYTSSSGNGFGINLSGSDLVINTRHVTTAAADGMVAFVGTAYTATSGTAQFLNIDRSFTPTSGTAVFNTFQIRTTINQTGGANGITRGLYVNPNLALGSGAADWRSIEWSNNTGWGLYGAGSAPSYFGGAISIGNTSTSSAAARVFLNYDATRTWGVRNDGTISSGAVNSIYYTSATRIAASVATTSVTHFDSSEISIGAGATITNQFGFVANSSLTSATNNFGFYGNIASGTGRWNFYANGTALNYMNGALLLGSTTSTGEQLQVTGTARITDVVTGSITARSSALQYVTAGSTNINQHLFTTTSSQNGTSGDTFLINSSSTFNPTSGTATYSNLRIVPVINQTGGANGITRGLLVAPTLTAAADWRSIEWTNNSGWGLYGSGTANNYLAGDTYIGTTTTSATKLTISGSETAAAAIARGQLINATLVAAANNDTLVGLDISPTFTNGAFTGVTNYDIRTSGTIYSRAIGIAYLLDNNAAIRVNANGGNMYIDAGNDLAGTIQLRATTVQLTSNIIAVGATFQSLNVTNPNNTIATVTGTGVTSLRIGNTTSSSTWFFENNRAAPSGSLEITNSIGVAGLTLFPSLNMALGNNTDAGFKLDVNGNTRIVGSGNTSATNALLVQNSAGTQLLRLYNIFTGGAATGLEIGDGTATNTTTIDIQQNEATIKTRQIVVNSTGAILRINGGTGIGNNNLASNFGSLTLCEGNYTLTNPTQFNVAASITGNFVPTSGGASFIDLLITPTINQTGGANGISRGLLVRPILTAAADWRSIEWSNNTGWGLYGAGTAPSYFGGSVAIGGTTNITSRNLNILKNITGNATSYAVIQEGVVQSDVTGTATGYFNAITTQNATFTLLRYVHFDAQQGTIGASSTVTNQFGFRAASSLTAATNNYGFYGDIASGTGRWNLYMNGTANNYLNGNLGMGVTPSAWTTGSSIKVIQFASGSVYNFSNQRIYIAQNFYYDGTNNIYNTTAAASLIEQALGYHAWWTAPSGTAGTIATLTERMRLNNVGNLLINSTTDSGERLQVNGTMKVTGASTFGGNISLTLNQNAATSLTISNSNNNSASYSGIILRASTNNPFQFFKASASFSYKIIGNNDAGLSNSNDGDISILNDFASGSIKMAAGGSSTAHFTIASTGAATFSSTVTASNGTLIGGSGTVNSIPKFTGTNALGNSSLTINTFSGTNEVLTLTSSNASSLELYNGTSTLTLQNFSNDVDLLYQRGVIVSSFLHYNGSSASDRYLALQTESIDRITIEQNGNVLIGTSVDSGDKLHVGGKSKFSDSMFITSSATTVTNGDYAGNFQKTYTPTATASNTNSYGIVSNTSWNLASASYTGSATYNAASMLFQVAIAGNATTKATQPFRGVLGTLVGISGGAAMNLSDFRFFEIKSPDANGVTGHVVDDMYGLKIASMKGSSNFTITNGWGIYQEGSTDNNYFNGKVLVGTSTPGGSILRLSGLPTSATGLSAGDVWNDAGTLKIV